MRGSEQHDHRDAERRLQVQHEMSDRSRYGLTRRCGFHVGEWDDLGGATCYHKGRVAKIGPGGGGSEAPKVDNKIIEVGWKVGLSSRK